MTNNGLVTIKNVRGYVGENGVAFLNLEDVARGLGFTRIAKSGNEVVRWERVKKYLVEITMPTSGHKEFDYSATSGALEAIATSCDGQGKENLPEFIPENIFYKLCMKANNEVARKFQDLVCDEILPSIRKNGVYATDDFITTALDNPDFAIKLLTELKEERAKSKKLETVNTHLQAENETQKQVIEELKPAKEYLDVILASPDVLAISQIAADYGMSGMALNKILNEEGLIRKVNGQWLLYKEHMNKGYTESNTYTYTTFLGIERTAITTYWTQKGRLKIHEVLTKLGIKANMDKTS